MAHSPNTFSDYTHILDKDIPTRYREEWEELGLVKPRVNKHGKVIRSVPFYAAQQLHRLHKVPRQLRAVTKPLVVTTSKIGEPFYFPQLDFDLRTTRPVPLSYNNLLDPHLKHFFNNPVKRRVLEKRGFITNQGDVVCNSMKELNQYRDMLYWNYSEMLKTLRDDVNKYLPKILAKRRAVADITAEKIRYNMLTKNNIKLPKKNNKSKKSAENFHQAGDSRKVSKRQRSSGKSKKKMTRNDVDGEKIFYLYQRLEANYDRNYLLMLIDCLEPLVDFSRVSSLTSNTDVGQKEKKAGFKGYKTRKRLTDDSKTSSEGMYALTVAGKEGSKNKKIWEKTVRDGALSLCHTHSCTERLIRQFEITDLPSMMKFLKDPVIQQAYRRNYLLRLMHTPNMDISGTMVKPLLRREVKSHKSAFRWIETE